MPLVSIVAGGTTQSSGEERRVPLERGSYLLYLLY